MRALAASARAVKGIVVGRYASSMAGETLQQQKDALRKAVRANLAKLSSEEIEHQCWFSLPQVGHMADWRQLHP
jgi:hypothetical protein